MEQKLRVEFPENLRLELKEAYLDQLVLRPGDDVMVNELNDSEAVGRIRSMCFDCAKGKVKVEVQWYYKPKDTGDMKLKKQCSEIELFLSDSFIELELGCIDGKVRILSLEEIIDLDEIEDDTFFTRARWITLEQKLDPPLVKWKRGCVCEEIINPDKPFKVCTNCKMFLHVDCLPKTGEQKCPQCEEVL